MRGRWLLFLALLGCGFEVAAFANLGFRPALLVVPLAAWAGWRHGWRGFEVVAVGASPLLVGLTLHAVRSPSSPGLYLVALAVAALVATGRAPSALVPVVRLSPGLVGAFVLMPISVFLGRRPLDSGLELFGSLGLFPVLCLGLFLLGLSPTRARLPLGLLAVATLAGMALRLGLQPGSLPFAYVLDRPADFLLGAALFHAGRHLAALHRGEPPSAAFARYRWGLVALLALLYGGAPLYERITALTDLGAAVGRALAPVGAYYALPLLGLVAGMVGRFRGVAIAVVVVAGLEALGLVLRYASTDAAAPLVAFGFGVLGVHLADHARGRATVWYPGRWGAYLGLAGLALALLLPGEDPGELLVAALVLALLVALALGARWIRRFVGRAGEGAVAGWIALAGALLLALGIARHLREAAAALLVVIPGLVAALAALLTGRGMPAPDEASLLGLAALFYLTVLLATLAELVRRLPALLLDLDRSWRWYASSRTSERWILTRADGDGPPGEEGLPPTGWIDLAARSLRWARNTAGALTMLGMVLTMATFG